MTRALSAAVVATAALVYWLPPPHGVSPQAMHAAALMLFTVGLWAVAVLPEHIVGLLFFALAMTLAVAPADVVFSGFASATVWLVLGGLVMAHAVHRTGLAQWLAGALFDRFTGSYPRLVVAVVMVSIILSFLIPATVGRTLVLLPIVMALARRVGFEHDSVGSNGLCLAAIVATYQCGTAVLPANAPNLVFAGAAEALHGVRITYAEYLWVQFPVMGALKSLAIIGFVLWLFPARAQAIGPSSARVPLTAEQKRMLVILVVALAFWVTDFLHGIQAGWIALAAAITCVLPGVGVMPAAGFNDVRLGPFLYVAATLGLGLVVHKTGLSEALGAVLQYVLSLTPGADFRNFMLLTVLATLAGLFTTNPAQPAVLVPLAESFAEAAGWPLKASLMAIAAGFTTFLAPYQVPPVVVGMQAGALRMAPMMRLALWLAAFGIVVMLPLHYLWWRVIGYFG